METDSQRHRGRLCDLSGTKELRGVNGFLLSLWSIIKPVPTPVDVPFAVLCPLLFRPPSAFTASSHTHVI